MKNEMTSRERVLESLKHKVTDRIPLGELWINTPAMIKLCEYLGFKSINEVEEYLRSHSDIRWYDPGYCGPADRSKFFSDGSHIDVWGVERKPVSYGDGHYNEISRYPLESVKDISDLDKHLWPSPEWLRVTELRDEINQIRKSKDVAIVVGNGNIFERSWYMRGFEQMLMDLIEEPELAWEIMTRVTDYFIGFFHKLLQAADGMIDIIYTADDIGQQGGPLMASTLWEKMIKPHHMRMNKVIHSYGAKVMYHSCGSVVHAVPDLIDMGIDILESLQFDAKGMDPVDLKEKYGNSLCFHGGVSVQRTLPFGTTEEVKNEVAERIKVLGKNGGYILAPAHIIQAGTPPENIIALLEARNIY